MKNIWRNSNSQNKNWQIVSKYADATDLPDAGLQYDVIGWYSDPEKNYLSEFLQGFKTSFQEDFPEEELTLETFLDAIKEELKWKFDWENETFTQDSEAPQIICYSRLIFKPSTILMLMK